MAIYFRVSDHREVPSSEALDARGVLRHGYGQRVPAHLRDSRFRDGRQLWDSGQLMVTDARAIGGLEGCKPGFRVLDCPVNRQEIADARAEYLHHLQNAWRSPLRLGDAAPPPDRDDDDEDGERLQGQRVRPVTADRRTVDQMAHDHHERMSELYSEYSVWLANQYKAKG